MNIPPKKGLCAALAASLPVAMAALLCASCSQPSPAPYDGSRLWLQAEHNGRPTLMTDDRLAHDPAAQTAAHEMARMNGAGTIELLLNPMAPHPEAFRVSKLGSKISIEGGSGAAVLYAAFHVERCYDMGADPNTGWQTPSFDLRVLNHWDNANGTVERGYAGRSLWKWDELPQVVSPRYEQYARANASVGINAVVLNNVNASPAILTPEYLAKVKALADVLRPYAQRVYLAVNFASPQVIGGLKTSDPLDPDVIGWWSRKADEIYNLIPDFGGFLVKGNSEGQPGPLDFGRSHADGANMLARALQPHGGIVMWRAFVYSPSDADRAKQAYLEFQPHDGEFLPNVSIQIKNGPVDFQPREPFSPLFGAMPQTRQMLEVQVTQEYTGHSNHLCFLPSMWLETLDADTYVQGPGSTISAITAGRLDTLSTPSAIAGVANVGDDANWCGHPFAQANWYAFGRMAWCDTLSVQTIAREWVLQTMGKDMPEQNVDEIVDLMARSREAVVDYMMPIGLHHIFAWGHHYGPEPWCSVPGARPDWLPSYYHRADSAGLGFDRSSTGSNAVAQYAAPLCGAFDDVNTCPPELLLWFHHVGWTDTLSTGRTLWAELNFRYDRGLDAAREFQAIWARQQKAVDPALWEQTNAKLAIQAADALWWHDACLLYFQTFCHLPLSRQAVLDLDSMSHFSLSISNYECAPQGYRPAGEAQK